jgi:hypothetical protein
MRDARSMTYYLQQLAILGAICFAIGLLYGVGFG